jgi:transglutaminase-like putative cysteine protease
MKFFETISIYSAEWSRMRAIAPVVVSGLALIVGAACSARLAGAQSPRITPKGDPSIRNDSIYSLVVRPRDYPGQPFVYLFEDGVVQFEEDGRAKRTYRLVIQILNQQAAEQWGEKTFSYTTGRQRLTVNWIRVLHLNGQVISDKPAHEQESIAPVAQEAPIYSDTRVRQYTLSGVAPNTIVDFSYTIEDTKPVVPGDFYQPWYIGTGHVTRRSRFILDVPGSLTPRIQERNIHFARRVTESHGRRVYVWSTTDVPRPEPEPFAPDTNPLYPQVSVAAPITWGGIASWYAALSKQRYKLTPALNQQLSTVVMGAQTLDDSLRAVHRWVAQDFRYVSLALGIGGYQPRTPMSVWETKYGDCKDKATLFIALARRMGVSAYPVLMSLTGGINRSLPSAYQLDHMIAAIARPGVPEGHPNHFLFVDLTSDLTPFGSIPPQEQGEFALVVYPDGRGEEVTLPADPVAVNRATFKISGQLAADGTFSGRYVEVETGSRQYNLRSAFATPFGDADRERLTRSLANALFQGATGDSLVSFNGRDLDAEPRVALAIKEARPVSVAGGTEILTLPIRDYSRPDILADLESRGYRRSPIDVESVVGPYEEASEFQLTLPEGWHARLPGNVDAESVFGRYHAHYAQHGRVLVIDRTIAGATGVQPAEQIDQLIAWLKQVARDDVRYIVLDPGAGDG